MAPRHRLPLDALCDGMPGEVSRSFHRRAPPARRRRLRGGVDRCVLCLRFNIWACADGDVRTAELYGMHRHTLHMTRAKVRAWHNHITAANGPGADPEWARNYKNGFEVRI